MVYTDYSLPEHRVLNRVLWELVEDEFPAFVIIELIEDAVAACSRRPRVSGLEDFFGSVLSVAYVSIVRVGVAEHAEN